MDGLTEDVFCRYGNPLPSPEFQQIQPPSPLPFRQDHRPRPVIPLDPQKAVDILLAGVFGRSALGLDKHDIEEVAPFGVVGIFMRC